MKKIITAILAIFYLSTATGATLRLHYCMDKLVAWGIGLEKTNKKSCPYCSMAKTTADKHCGKQSKGCCKDEQKQVKIEKDQKTADVGFNLVKPILQIAYHATFDLPAIEFNSPTLVHPSSHAPPQTGNNSLFLFNCVFRI
jgi:glutaredoxin